MNNTVFFNFLISHHNYTGLQIGCGKNILQNWLNTDLKFHKNPFVCKLDMTKPFPIINESFKFVYSEHSVEHISKENGKKLFNEVYRILKPGGVFRLSLPTQDLFNKLKTGNYPDYVKWHFDEFDPDNKNRSVEQLIKNFSTMWGHQIIYDPDDLINILKSVGFKDVYRCEIGESKYSELQNIENHGNIIGKKFNELESTVIECIKDDRL